MPDAPYRPCPGGCGTKVRRGRCPACTRTTERRYGSRHERGYGTAWDHWRPVYIAMLIAAGVAPVCGASLLVGPHSDASNCQAQGLLTFTSRDGSSLHLDHEPPLEPHERRDVNAVCDPMRITLLCSSCHAAKGDGTFRHASQHTGGRV